jgi:hypothetical protein
VRLLKDPPCGRFFSTKREGGHSQIPAEPTPGAAVKEELLPVESHWPNIGLCQQLTRDGGAGTRHVPIHSPCHSFSSLKKVLVL